MAEGIWKTILIFGVVLGFSFLFPKLHLPREGIKIMLCLCMMGILSMTLFVRGQGTREMHLIPFLHYSAFLEYFSAPPYSDPRYTVVEILNNIILFMPLAYLLKCLGIRSSYTIIICFLCSLLIEICQFCFSLGVSETDDIISNTLGAGFGVLLYKLFYRQQNQRGDTPDKGAGGE